MKLRNILTATGAAIALSAAAGGALAAGSVSATATATATIISPVTITKTQDMVFGSIVRPVTGTNTIILNTSDVVSKTGAGDASLIAGATKSAKFNITVTGATTYTTTQTLTFTTLGLTGIAASLPVATTGTLGTIPAAGTQEIRYGGQFDIDPATPPTTYIGALNVTVNYP